VGRVGGHRDVSSPFRRPRKKRGSGLEASFENRGASRRRCWIARFGDFARTVHPAGDARGGFIDGRGDRHGHGGRCLGGLGASATHGEKFEFGTRRAGSSEWKSSDSASDPRHPADEKDTSTATSHRPRFGSVPSPKKAAARTFHARTFHARTFAKRHQIPLARGRT